MHGVVGLTLFGVSRLHDFIEVSTCCCLCDANYADFRINSVLVEKAGTATQLSVGFQKENKQQKDCYFAARSISQVN